MKKNIVFIFILFLGINTILSAEPKLGFAGYTFRYFSLDSTLTIMKKLDVGYLCIKDFHLPLKASLDDIKKFKEKCNKYGVEGYAVGPIYMKSKSDVDLAFDYASRIGVKMMIGVPNYELLSYVEEKVKKYDIKYAIHLHGPDIELYPDATDIWNNICNLDPRMGICFDIGHELRNGCDIISDINKYHSRIFDVHIKDVTEDSKYGKAIQIGRGIINIPKVVDALQRVGYNGIYSIEYEKDMKDPLLGIGESVGYVKAIFSVY